MLRIPIRSVTIEAGQTTGTFSIRILDDLLVEGSQTFTLTLSNIKGAVFANNSSTIPKTVTIVDDETPIIRISTTDFNIAEETNSFVVDLALLRLVLLMLRLIMKLIILRLKKG